MSARSLRYNEHEKNISKWKYAVRAVIFVTFSVTISAYVVLRQEEEAKFRTAFSQFSTTLGDAALNHQYDLKNALTMLSNGVTISATNAGAKWPFFWSSGFELLAEDFRTISSAELVAINNFVAKEERDAYTNWTKENYQEWIKEGHIIAYGNLDKLDNDTARFNPFITRNSGGTFVIDEEREYYAVRTTHSPPPRAYGPVTNWNVNSVPTTGDSTVKLLEWKNQSIFSQSRPFQALPADEHASFHTDSSLDHPHSFVTSPIHEELNNPNSKIVAMITAVVAWDTSMLNLLPSNVRGICCVIKNSCGQVYTYEIDGADALYKGEGDYHNDVYDNMEAVIDLSLHSHPNYTTWSGNCLYRMHMYPSKVFESAYKTSTPVAFLVVVATAIFLTAAVFIGYSIVMDRQSRQISTDAARANAVVDSMFPGQIRDRVLEQQGADPFAAIVRNKSIDELTCESSREMKMPLLAEAYEDTTLFFGDIVGFTRWSSGRNPEKVFKLLESIYCALDELAVQNGIYKVETVGDCYVAIAGCPAPMANHAVEMAKFAKLGERKMREVVNDLVPSLGKDTATLSLRIGLHSGSVIGGVLRGERGRFQLFGSTMNYSSRMESTGEPGKIQISQATADLLTAAGKQAWFVPRKDVVAPKGIGEVKTYWLTVDQEQCALPVGSEREPSEAYL